MKKKNKKSRNNVMLISEVCLVWNLWWRISLIEIILFGTLWVDHSLRFRQVFVSISFRTYHLFVNQATLQPWKALVILAFVFSTCLWMNAQFSLLFARLWRSVFFIPHLCVFFIYRWIFARCDSWLSLFCFRMFCMIFVLRICFVYMLLL